MALPFYQLLGIDLADFPDGGMFDPDTGTSFAGMPGAITPNTTQDTPPTTTPTTTAPTTTATTTKPRQISGSETLVVNGRIVNRISFDNGETVDQDLGPEGGYGYTPPTTTTTNNSTATPGQQQGSTDPNSPNYDPQQAQRQSAFEVLRERFTVMGLAPLAAELEKIFKGTAKTRAGSPIPIPTSESGFYLALIETEEYYKRFGKTNELRTKAGYTALDERTILAMEDEYQKMMKSYGMPAGFYDTPEDFQTFLANDLSQLELADRLQASRQFANGVSQEIKDQLKSLYNIDENMLSAYIADPEKGQAVLNNLASRSLTGAAALLSGLTAEAAKVAETFGAGEMRFAEQQQRFGQAATLAERGSFLSQIENAEKEFGQKEAVEVTFGGLEQSIKAAEKLASRERARFSGTSGTTVTSFTRPTAGQF